MALLDTVIKTFESEFGAKPTMLVRAPGRVNLIGEHTDYNDGFVLPCAINYETLVALTPRDDNKVRVVASAYPGQVDEYELDAELTAHPKQLWSNYIRGVSKYLLHRGYKLGGLNMAVAGNVPQGAGLSSSAALEVAIGQAFKEAYGISISQAEIALNGQQAENQFVGCNCGIMDQLISAEGQADHALLIDCRDLNTTQVSMPKGYRVFIINSNVKRGLVDSAYNERREQCEAAAQFFGVKALRDVSIDTFNAKASGLDELTQKRARHVITENQRTLEAAEALKVADIERLAELMEASHQSMRDDFEITVPAIDHIVDIVKEVIGTQGGVRMTGGGFGGCVVSFIPEEMIDAVQQAIDTEYPKRTDGLTATTYRCFATDGAGRFNV